MKIFIDFDGTLIDSRTRIYGLFKKISGTNLTFDQYWELKRNQVSNSDILIKYCDYTDVKLQKFNDEWFPLIEHDDWLIFDEPLPGITDFLKKLSYDNTLILVTARQRIDKVFDQIVRFGWQDLFQDILVTQQEKEKEALISSKYDCLSTDYIIGDSGKDILAGKALGLKTIAVLSGSRNKLQLSKYNPDFIVDSIVDFNF